MNKEKIAQKVREENNQYAALLQKYVDMGMSKEQARKCITEEKREALKEKQKLHSNITFAVVAVCVVVIAECLSSMGFF